MVYTAEELDEINKYKEKLEKQRAYNRVYMANKRANDPDFYAKQKAYNAQRKRDIYNKKEEYVEKEKEYKQKWYEKKKTENLRIKELIDKAI